MTIFGNVRQWNRPRAPGPGGGPGRARAASAPPARAAGRSHLRRHLPSSRRVRCWRQRGPERGREGSSAPPPPAPLPPPLVLRLLPPPPRPQGGVGVDVSESTWYRGWRLKSVELNSCHCSDSSRAERRGSERTSQQTSGARRGRRGREDPTGEAGPSESGRRGRGAGPGAGTATRGAGPRPSQRRFSLNSTGWETDAGCLLVKCPSRSETPEARRPQEVYSQFLF